MVNLELIGSNLPSDLTAETEAVCVARAPDGRPPISVCMLVDEFHRHCKQND